MWSEKSKPVMCASPGRSGKQATTTQGKPEPNSQPVGAGSENGYHEPERQNKRFENSKRRLLNLLVV